MNMIDGSMAFLQQAGRQSIATFDLSPARLTCKPPDRADDITYELEHFETGITAARWET